MCELLVGEMAGSFVRESKDSTPTFQSFYAHQITIDSARFTAVGFVALENETIHLNRSIPASSFRSTAK